VTRLHHRWGASEAEIFVFKFLPWPGFEPRTSQSNERYHSTTETPPMSFSLKLNELYQHLDNIDSICLVRYLNEAMLSVCIVDAYIYCTL